MSAEQRKPVRPALALAPAETSTPLPTVNTHPAQFAPRCWDCCPITCPGTSNDPQSLFRVRPGSFQSCNIKLCDLKAFLEHCCLQMKTPKGNYYMQKNLSIQLVEYVHSECIIHPFNTTINVEGEKNQNEVQIGLWCSPI